MGKGPSRLAAIFKKVDLSMNEFKGCPGSKMIDRTGEDTADAGAEAGTVPSQLRQWPVQMHLISPEAPYFQGADVLLVADCVPFAMGGFHGEYLQGRSIGIACPKLDEGQDVYLEKVKSWIDDAKINTLSVMIMEVPCCMGLAVMAESALAAATRKIPLKRIIVGVDGAVRHEEWVNT